MNVINIYLRDRTLVEMYYQALEYIRHTPETRNPTFIVTPHEKLILSNAYRNDGVRTGLSLKEEPDLTLCGLKVVLPDENITLSS